MARKEEIKHRINRIICKYFNDIDYLTPNATEDVFKLMQEYAEAFHKEKLREELILFASQRNEQHFFDWESKYMISVNEINDFLNTKE